MKARLQQKGREDTGTDILRGFVPLWPKPKSRDFAALSDCGLYAEVLQVASAEESISAAKLISTDEGLRQRLRRLHVVQNPTKTNITALLAALEAFGWLNRESIDQFKLTLQGDIAARESLQDPISFRRRLAAKLHQRYVVPGWFVARLHALNPSDQGAIVLPAPPKFAKTERRAWSNKDWPTEFNAIVVSSADRANTVFPGSFNADRAEWLDAVVEAWDRLAAVRPPLAKRDSQAKGELAATFSPRERLFHAMREAAVNLLFSAVSPQYGVREFPTSQPPIPPRAFQVWCPRLDELEFIFYTDYHPEISGRVIVPCGAFRDQATAPPFEALPEIIDPERRNLWLFQPRWQDIGQDFVEVLQSSYQRTAKKVGALYVSLLNVRDEVCRQLRLSSRLFDSLLQSAYRQTIKENSAFDTPISISLESDIRHDQWGAVGLNRRPVYVNNIPHSLISIGKARG
jgi:hypothetical protein